MSIEARWDHEDHHIIYVGLRGQWLWAELYQALETAEQLARSVAHEVAAIVDIRGGLNLPGGSLFLTENIKQVRSLLARNSGQHGPIVVVGADADARMVYDSLRMMDSRVGARVVFTDTLDEARAYLQNLAGSILRAC